MLNGWGENNDVVIEITTIPSAKNLGNIDVNDSFFIGSRSNDKFLTVTSTIEYGINLTLDHVRLQYPITTESIIDFSGKPSSWSTDIYVLLNDVKVTGSFDGETKSLIKTHASQPAVRCQVEVGYVGGIDRINQLHIGSGTRQGLWSKYGNNTFLNGIKLSEENLSGKKGRLFFNEYYSRLEFNYNDTNSYALQSITRNTTEELNALDKSKLITGECRFNTTIGKPVWFNGAVWIDGLGATI